MERHSDGDAALDEEDGDHIKTGRLGDGDAGIISDPAGSTTKTPDICTDTLASRVRGLFLNQSEEKSEETGHDLMFEGQAGFAEPDASLTSSSYSSSLQHINFPSSSSSSSTFILSLSPPLPPTVELSAVLTDTRLTLDVYQGGAAALPLLWGSIPGQLMGLQYLRLGSEDRSGLDGALDVLPHLTELRSLTIRGNFTTSFYFISPRIFQIAYSQLFRHIRRNKVNAIFINCNEGVTLCFPQLLTALFFPILGHCLYDSQCEPLPGLLTTLPKSVSSLCHLVHVDLSFNQLSCLPSCLLRLPLLSSLLLCHNHISALPPGICQLSSLTYISLLGNKLMSLPPSLGQLKELQRLDVSYNLLQELPDEIGALGNLVELDLSNNKLKQLPESMGKNLRVSECVRQIMHKK